MASNDYDRPPRNAIFPSQDDLKRAPLTRGPNPQEFDGPDDLLEDEEGTVRAAVPAVAWPKADGNAPDYAHLEPDGREPVVGDKRFWIAAPDIERLIEANAFDPRGPGAGEDGRGGRIVIAIRGANLIDEQDDDDDGVVSGVDRLYLEETRPDHENFRCVIGYYDRTTGKFSAYTASTVPHVKYMKNFYMWTHGLGGDGRTKANMTPTGCYVFRIGVHAGKIRPALRLTDPDDLTDDGSATVLRTTNDLTFTLDDEFDRCKPYNNVHCAYSDTTFFSAGCLTIKGRDGAGPWGRFQSVLKTLRYDTRIDVVLLTGREGSIAAWLRDTGRKQDDEMARRLLTRLRVGSVGDAVNRLQDKLGIKPSGYFGPYTKSKLADYQRANNLPYDGIWSPRLEAKLGWSVLAPPPAQPAPVQPEPAQQPSPAVQPSPAMQPPPAHQPGPVAAATGRAAVAGAAVAGTVGALTGAVRVTDARPTTTPQAPTAPAPAPSAPVAPAPALAPGAAGASVTNVPAPAIVSVQPRLQLTDECIRTFAPRALPEYRDALLSGNDVIARYALDQHPLRLCHFLGQIGNECGRLTILEENLNYRTAARLRAVWPSRFPTLRSAESFVGNPQKLAEKVYGGRFDNRPGDGWRFRGRGLVQITGRANYREMGKRLGIPLEDQPELAIDPHYALAIACETWANKQLNGERDMNALADANKLEALTYRINGGYTNLEDRRESFEEAWKIWADGKPPRRVLDTEVLDRGDRNQRVEELNARLAGLGLFEGITSRPPQQVYNYSTYRAVCALQQKGGMGATGVVGAETWGLMEKALDRGPFKRSIKRGAPAVRRAPPPKLDPQSRSMRDVRAWSIALSTVAILFVVGYIFALNDSQETREVALWLPVLFAATVFIFGLASWLAARVRPPQPASETAARSAGPGTRAAASAPPPDLPGVFDDGEEEPVRMGINI